MPRQGLRGVASHRDPVSKWVERSAVERPVTFDRPTSSDSVAVAPASVVALPSRRKGHPDPEYHDRGGWIRVMREYPSMPPRYLLPMMKKNKKGAIW